MFHVDVPRVRGKIAERGETITSTAKELGISRDTFSGYLRAPDKIPYEVLDRMAALLCDSAEEALAILFAADLR